MTFRFDARMRRIHARTISLDDSAPIGTP